MSISAAVAIVFTALASVGFIRKLVNLDIEDHDRWVEAGKRSVPSPQIESEPVKLCPAYRSTHERAITLISDLSEEQFVWRPDPGSPSIAFHFWHLARWADQLNAAIPEGFPVLARLLGEQRQIWEVEDLASHWGLNSDLLGIDQTGMEMDGQIAARLALPTKAVLLEYAARAFAAGESTVNRLDELSCSLEQADRELVEAVQTARTWVMEHLIHDNRHLGMMECLKGLLTGRGTATR